MNSLISYIVSSIAEDVSDIKVELLEGDNDIKVLITTGPKSKSKLIGREGKVINSIRDYFKSVSKKFNKKIYIEINEN
ncbi:MAG TPA: KH domain-containing protein [Elusimicrobiales bacterium]|nr:KH domain-containing protein [Elusimicrobiales bacterium]HOL62491.1 KH domain-containing protein [Elusimicrobiales bacterium]HPO96158.1 KH domain-containing protein [Elusimicrobiales bacterium]